MAKWLFVSLFVSCLYLLPVDGNAQGDHADPSRANQATPVRIADAACASCHAAVTTSYLATPMANASGLAADHFESGTFLHRLSGVTYSFAHRPEGPVFTFADRGATTPYPARDLQYFLGSGHLGLTYLYTVNRYLFETPLAYYASHGLDMKPGLESLTTAAPALPVQAECMRCHMSAVARSDAGTLNRYSGLPFAHTGITCESCHGDTTSHVASKGKAAVLNPSRLSADARDSICISCHLEGDVSVDRAGKSIFDFKPGDSIAQYRAYFVYRKQDAAARGVSEVEQFNQSKCKRTSGSSMSCTSCHDPHVSPAPEKRVEFYRAKCLTCHSSATFLQSHHPDQPDCVSCHMPRTGAQNTPHVAWTDHRILRVPALVLASMDKVNGNTLIPVLSPSATERDLAMANYHGLLEGNSALATKAYDQLQALRTKLSTDTDALNALGVLSENRGDAAHAAELFRQVLALDPDNLIASTNLGTLSAKAGDLQAAIAFWEPVAARNENITSLNRNLAQAKCTAGNIAGARTRLQRALSYSPGSADLQRMLSNLPACEAH